MSSVGRSAESSENAPRKDDVPTEPRVSAGSVRGRLARARSSLDGAHGLMDRMCICCRPPQRGEVICIRAKYRN
jgi:hypothetical protein